jgi:hypothetical protein
MAIVMAFVEQDHGPGIQGEGRPFYSGVEIDSRIARSDETQSDRRQRAREIHGRCLRQWLA